MAAKPDPQEFIPEVKPARPEAKVLRWKPVSPAAGEKMSDPAAPEKLRPVRGMLFGLLLGAILWFAIGVFAWQFFR